jgi:hypothetical protein
VKRYVYVPGMGIADDGDISAGNTNEAVDVRAADDAKKSTDHEDSGIVGVNNLVAADVAGGSGSADVDALAESDGDTGDGDELRYEYGELPNI